MKMNFIYTSCRTGKKIISTLLLITCFLPCVFAEVELRETTLNLNLATADYFNVGFSSGMVTNLRMTPQEIPNSEYELLYNSDGIGQNNPDKGLYVYWQIIYKDPLNLILTLSGPMQGQDSNKAGWDVSVEEGDSVSIKSEGDKDNWVMNPNEGIVVYSYPGRSNLDTTTIGNANSKKLTIETDTLEKDTGRYVGQMILTLVTI